MTATNDDADRALAAHVSLQGLNANEVLGDRGVVGRSAVQQGDDARDVPVILACVMPASTRPTCSSLRSSAGTGCTASGFSGGPTDPQPAYRRTCFGLCGGRGREKARSPLPGIGPPAVFRRGRSTCDDRLAADVRRLNGAPVSGSARRPPCSYVLVVLAPEHGVLVIVQSVGPPENPDAVQPVPADDLSPRHRDRRAPHSH
jgi:hypothetical protein